MSLRHRSVEKAVVAAVLAIQVIFLHLVDSITGFTVETTKTKALHRMSGLLAASSSSPLDDELSRWAAGAGYGGILSSKPAGSSGWASFRRVELEDPSAPTLFVKSSSKPAATMFEGEFLGLRAMYECSSHGGGGSGEGLRIPQVFHCADIPGGRGSVLVMEYLKLGGRSDDRALGRAVARMHLAPPKASAGNPTEAFGFALDNTIGDTPQPNRWTKGGAGTDEWIEFYRDLRIGHQLNLAGDSYCSQLWEDKIAPRLGLLFEGTDVRPSLLHGDLWSGNIATADGLPTIYDPATYWGHHEAEWGMSWCASFSASFWDGYRSLIPEDEGFLDRKPLYDAYHQLNHYNLFGGSYLGAARGCLESVARKIDVRSDR